MTRSKRTLRIFVRCMLAQLRNGTESIAHGPANCGIPLHTIEPVYVTAYDSGHGAPVWPFETTLHLQIMCAMLAAKDS